MPVFESKSDAYDPAGEAMLARLLFPTDDVREAAIARGRRIADGQSPFAVRPASSSSFPVAVACNIPSGALDGSFTTSAA